MKLVSLDALANELAKPGFERELIPLLAYRGHSNLGRVHRMWNLTVAMMMHEAESIGRGINHLHMNPEWSHLCFPEKRLQSCNMHGFLNRLRDNPSVTDLVPGLTDYAAMLMPRWYPYQRISQLSADPRCAWWRTYDPSLRAYHGGGLPVPDDFYVKASGQTLLWASQHYGHSLRVVSRWFQESGTERAPAFERGQILAYPFLLHKAKRGDHELLRIINDAIPHNLPDDLRADMCQDLAVGVLTGDFNKDDLYLPAKEVAKRVYRMFPTKYGPISLDAILPGTDDFRMLDTLVDEGRDWA